MALIRTNITNYKNQLVLTLSIFLLLFANCNLFATGAYSFLNVSSIVSSSSFLFPAYFFLLPNIPLPQFEDPDNLFETDTSEYKPLFRYSSPLYSNPYNNDLYRKSYTPGNTRQSFSMDSSMSFSSSAKYEGIDVNPEYKLELDEYLRTRKQELQQGLWDSLVTTYDLKKALTGGDLAKMMATATGLSIPIPPNPLIGIFGKPEISINVQGEVNIRIGWRFDTQNLGTVSAFGQSQSTPVFHQDIRVNVSGGIGDKLKLSTDWNTRRTFDRDNRFKIGYDGYDDDIIKKVEVGNVNLPLPTQLIQGGQTLFGVRTDYQFGPLYLKTILSQRRGERRFVDVRGGASKTYFQIRAYDYARNHFFLDNAYKPVWNEYFKNSTPIIPQSATPLRIKEIEVWESTNNITDVNTANGIAFATLEPLAKGVPYPADLQQSQIIAGQVERGRFMRLDTMKYRIDRNLGHLTIYNLRQDRTYAVSYRTENTTTAEADDMYHGQFSRNRSAEDTSTALILKLIYSPNLQPQFDTLWSRQMRNIYPLNSSNINIDETTINMWYIRQSNDSTDVIEGSPDKLVTIFGVDKVDQSGNAIPDGVFDKRPPSPFFDPQRGEIVFPSVEPFREGLRDYFTRIQNPDVAEAYIYPEVYTEVVEIAKRNTSRDRFIISGEVSGRATGRIPLGAFNLAPGSVRVTLDGIQLKEYQDFTIDYYAGVLQIRNERAALPGANLKIEYEQQDIFNIATKTLAGIRADYNLVTSRKGRADLGFTLMHYDQAAIIDRVQLGQEPVSNTMIGFDANVVWQTPFITKLLDALPFYDTKAESNITLGGEWAMILPDPNKRRSSVASDRNSPVVYIDDFEGAQRYINLGLNAAMWQHSSQPVDSSIGATDEERALYRGKLFWFRKFIPDILQQDVYPERPVLVGRNNISAFEISFNPYRRGIYNMNPEFLDDANPEFDNQFPKFIDQPENIERVWGGMQRLLSTFTTNFDNENIEFIEIMMKVDAWEPGKTKMFIDMGQISEDIIPNGVLDMEDGITPNNPIPNGIIDPGEDVGIDGLNNEQEKVAYPFPLNLEDDPARDDYRFNFGRDNNNPADFEAYNNFEGNAISEAGMFPDSEILNDNNGLTLMQTNSYFRYEVNLEPDPKVNPQIVGGNEATGWYLYRIPVRKPSSSVGTPAFTNVQYIRVSLKGGLFFGKIVDWRLVGSQWQRVHNFSPVPPQDDVMQLSFVNLFENSKAPDNYTMPPGVQAPRQLNNPTGEDIRLNEQSLAVTVTDLNGGDERMTVRIYPSYDIFFYKKLKFFIHGEDNMAEPFGDVKQPQAYAFVRFGTDSSNYYEYRTPIVRGWKDVEVDLEELTGIKQLRETQGFNIQERFIKYNAGGDPNATFAIKGTPVLTRIQFFGLGVGNPNSFQQPLTTTAWFNELRLIEPERSADWSAIGSASIKLADLGTISASFKHSKPNFHSIEERFGDRNTKGDFNVTMQGNLEKFAPPSFKAMKLPIAYTHAEQTIMPEFVANSDVKLDVAAEAVRANALANGATNEEALQLADSVRRRSQSVRVQDRWSLTGVQLGIPIKFFLVDQTLNKITFGYSYAQEFERSPIFEQRFNWMWQADAKYSNNIPNVLEFEPLKWANKIPIIGSYSRWKLNLLPSNINLGMQMNRRRQTEQNRFLDFASPVVRDFNSIRTASFNWKLSQNGFLSPVFDYNVSTTSALLSLELDENGRQRTGSELTRQIFFKDGQFMDLGENTLHTQTVTMNLKPQLPELWGMDKYTTFNGSFTTTYNWQNPLQRDPAIRDISKNAGYNNNINFRMEWSLKDMADNWWGIKKTPQFGRSPATQDNEESGGILSAIGKTFKFIVLDYERINFRFNQTNMATNPGVFGGNGITNFWGRGLTGRPSEDILGPSFLYQLGLIGNPHGGFNVVPSDRFPYFGFQTFTGLRPPNGVMQDNYKQDSKLDISTSRELWPGAKLDLTWNTTLGYSNNYTAITDEFGVPEFSAGIELESFKRSFHTFPTLFGFNPFGNTIENVVAIYEERKAVIEANVADEFERAQQLGLALSESFYEGLEAFSFTAGQIGKFLPAVNWNLTWEGLEKLSLFKGLAKKVLINHAYTSSYDEAVQITDIGRVVQNQQVNYGFSPLVGVRVTFDEDTFDGILTTTFNWNAKTGYNLNSAAQRVIAQQSSNEISAQASYVMQGFSFSLLGLELENDLEFSFLLKYAQNRRATFDILDAESFNGNQGRVLNGDTRITVEPRVRYSVSRRLTASFFVKYDGTFTEGAATPGFHTTEVGFDLRLSVAGGR